MIVSLVVLAVIPSLVAMGIIPSLVVLATITSMLARGMIPSMLAMVMTLSMLEEGMTPSMVVWELTNLPSTTQILLIPRLLMPRLPLVQWLAA
jgi:hypothetical protein